MFTREELKDTKDKLSFMGVVFDVSGLNPMMKEMLTRYGPPEWMLLRLMPCKGSEKYIIFIIIIIIIIFHYNYNFILG